MFFSANENYQVRNRLFFSTILLILSRNTLDEFQTKFFNIMKHKFPLNPFNAAQRRMRINFSGTELKCGKCKGVVRARISIVSLLHTRLVVVDDAPEILLCFQ